MGFWIGLALLLVPLPGLPTLPTGAEIRVVSPNLRAVYMLWRVEERTLWPLHKPRLLPPGRPVRVLIRVGRRIYVFEGRTDREDVVLFVRERRVSLKRLFKEVYRLKIETEPPPRLRRLEERRVAPRPGDRRRP